MRLVTASLIGLLVATPLLAQEPVREEREHVVKKGDTLWDLAGFYYENPFRWPVIHQANTMVVEDPHWIYPDEVLVIPGLYDSVVPAAPGDEAIADAPVAPVSRERPLRTVFYREPPVRQQGPTVLVDVADVPAPVRVGEFISADYLAVPETLPRYGRLLRPKRETGMRGFTATAHPKDEVYIEYSGDVPPDLGQRLLLVDVGRSVSEAGRYHHIIQPRAVVEIVELGKDVMTAVVEGQYGEVRRGLLAVPMEAYPEFTAPAAEPVPGGADLRGQVLEWVDEQPLYGPTDRAFIDLGREDGVQVGDVFLAYLPSRTAQETSLFGTYGASDQLPPEAVAELRVVRVMDSAATVVVDDLVLPRLHDGIWVQRVRKMP